ncbi:MAG: hypothetical protein LQ349_004234 [Xanthoria aureola]|nr:MAG: hypothetical protein LQ349_004234 [Xanthoria aureola]
MANDSMVGVRPCQLSDVLDAHGLYLVQGDTVRWKQDCVQHPRNWSKWKKLYNAVVTILLDYFITVVGTVGTAAARDAAVEYNIERTTALLAFTSMYFIGQAIGAVCFPPYSESFGRKPIYLASMSLFAIFSIPIGAAHSLPAVFIGRFMTGLLSSTPCIVVAGSLEDTFDSQTRLWLVSVWLIIANLALITGPIFASYVAFLLGWRWIFHICSIAATLCFLLLLATWESRATHLLKRRVVMISQQNSDIALRIENPDNVPDFPTFVRLIVRPLRLLFTEPIVAMVSIISGTAFALVYLFIEVLPIIYGEKGFTKQQSSLVLIAIALGFSLTPLTRLYDYKRFKKAKRQGRLLTPEEKLMGFAVAAPAFAIGLWCFAWTVPPEVPGLPWIVSALALVPIGFAINEFDCVLVGYLTESYTTFSSSAFASFSMVRSALSATFPLFAHAMYEKLGANYATTILAAAATAACVCPIVLIRYGRRTRQASRFAQYSLTVGITETNAHEMEDMVVAAAVPAGDKGLAGSRTSIDIKVSVAPVR